MMVQLLERNPVEGFYLDELKIILDHVSTLTTDSKNSPELLFQIQRLITLNPTSFSSNHPTLKQLTKWIIVSLGQTLLTRSPDQSLSDHIIHTLHKVLNWMIADSQSNLVASLHSDNEFVESLLSLYPIYHLFSKSHVILHLINSILLMCIIHFCKSDTLFFQSTSFLLFTSFISLPVLEWSGVHHTTWKSVFRYLLPEILLHLPYPHPYTT